MKSRDQNSVEINTPGANRMETSEYGVESAQDVQFANCLTLEEGIA
jgi:hypothetical protein